MLHFTIEIRRTAAAGARRHAASDGFDAQDGTADEAKKVAEVRFHGPGAAIRMPACAFHQVRRRARTQ
jgi:hypothetical protein